MFFNGSWLCASLISAKLTFPLPHSKIFPPTEHDLSPPDQENQPHNTESLAAMPDPPARSPAGSPTGASNLEDPPSTKTQNLDSATALDQDWEQVEKPEVAISDELAASKGDMSEEGERVKGSSAMEEQRATALHTAVGGGDPPQSGLLRDW